MPRGVQLDEMLDAFRAECKISLDRASSQNAVELHRYALRNAQQALYTTYDWPFLKTIREEALQVGERLYNLPTDLPFENITKVETLWGAEWVPVLYGIENPHYNAFPEGVRSDPVMRWQNREPQYEVWPTPASSGTLRFTGKRALARFIAGSDRCTLDDHLIVLYAAWKWLSDPTEKEAKLQELQLYSLKLRGQQTAAKAQNASLLGSGSAASHYRPGIDFMPG